MTQYFFKVQNLIDDRSDFLSTLSKKQVAKIRTCLNHAYNENKKEGGDNLPEIFKKQGFGFVTNNDYSECLAENGVVEVTVSGEVDQLTE